MGRDCCGGVRTNGQEMETKKDGKKFVPSEEMGDYEVMKNKKERKKSGPLYPLTEECSYGAPPAALPKPLPGYQKRERKTKVYASYAVDSDCCAHGDMLSKNESDRGRSPPKSVRKRSNTPTRPTPPAATPTRERKNSGRTARGPSPAPSLDSYTSRPTNWQNSLRSSQYREPSLPRTQRKSSRVESKSPERPQSRQLRSPSPSIQQPAPWRSQSSDGRSSSQSSTDWGYTSYGQFHANRSSTQSATQKSSYRSTSSSYKKASSSFKNSSYKEKEEKNPNNKGGNISLDKLKIPTINAWDSMGILGLSSKMYSETSEKERFSAASFVRKESVSTHAM